jgi:thiol peroxidase
MTERAGGVMHKGLSLTVVGDKLKVGNKAPNFEVSDNLFSPEMVSFAESAGKVRLINVVVSVNTGVCDPQIRRFSEEIGKYGDDVVCYTVSVDLPIAQETWCSSAGIENIKMVSDYRDMAFGKAYGTYVKELRIEQRSVFIVDADDTVRYVEYVPEIGQHPDYDAALAALADVVG